MGKIKLRYQIGDLGYDVVLHHWRDTSYNLLLWRQWIHRNAIVPSIFHQVMKYSNKGVVRTLITERYPFKGVENYFTDSLLYQVPLEAAENPSPEDSYSISEADTELEAEEECLWEINPIILILISSISITLSMLKASDLLMRIRFGLPFCISFWFYIVKY